MLQLRPFSYSFASVMILSALSGAAMYHVLTDRSSMTTAFDESSSTLQETPKISQSLTRTSRTAMASPSEVRRALEEHDPQIHVAIASLRDLSPSEIRTYLKQFETLPGNPNRAAFLSFVSQWAKVDPKEALAYVGNGSNRYASTAALSEVMRQWARIDTETAVAYTEDETNTRRKPHLRLGLIRGLASIDLDRATEVALSPEEPGRRVEALRVLAVSQASSAERAQRWLTLFHGHTDQDREIKSVALRALAEAGRYVPAMHAFLKKEVQADYVNSHTLATVAMTLHGSYRDRLEWMRGQTSQAAEEAQVFMLDDWAAQAPNEAGEWLGNQLTGDAENLDPLLVRYVHKVYRRDPEAAIAWAETISDKTLRDSLSDLWEAPSGGEGL